jgi:hypothetical protein
MYWVVVRLLMPVAKFFRSLLPNEKAGTVAKPPGNKQPEPATSGVNPILALWSRPIAWRDFHPASNQGRQVNGRAYKRNRPGLPGQFSFDYLAGGIKSANNFQLFSHSFLRQYKHPSLSQGT